MAIDIAAVLDGCDDLAARTPNALARGMEGSAILAIASAVNVLSDRGVDIANFTVGDFKPSQFSIPPALADGITKHLEAGNTNYPPAIGIPELRAAVRALYKRDLGLDYPEGCVQIGSGARPPLYAAFMTVLEPGDIMVYGVPSWNNPYYAYLNGATAVGVETRAENGFLPTVEDLAPHMRQARLICLNSPLNPAGTAMTKEQLQAICEAIVGENRRRSVIGDRPLILLYDQVYWQLVFGGTEHFTPVGLVPEMAKYTVFIDAISKCWAATGVRLGWAVCPPWMRDRMKPLIGHMGAWAGRAEQHATAELLAEPERLGTWPADFTEQVQVRLKTLRSGLLAMKADGLPVDALEAQGALYLTVKFALLGKTLRGQPISTDDDIRRYLLEETHTAIVPFTAFGMTNNTGWVRFSIGAVSVEDIEASLGRIRTALVRDLAG
ncbi:MAG: aspartate aminotransferase [Myxococcota bacterium]|jgi:aspartate aminotransferase